MRLWMLAQLERAFRLLAEWAEEMRQRCAYCPDCGRNRYTGAPCAQGGGLMK